MSEQITSETIKLICGNCGQPQGYHWAGSMACPSQSSFTPVTEPKEPTTWAEAKAKLHKTESKEVITDETVVGEINTDDYATGGCGCGCVPRDIILRAKGLDEPYRTLLLEAEANAKYRKAWDKLVKKIQAEMFESDREGNIEARNAFYTVESWMQDLLQM